MSTDIRNVKDLNGLIAYFADKLQWNIDLDDFDDIEDIAYDFDAEDIGLKEEAFAKIKTLLQLPPLVDGQKWGIICVEFDSKHFEVTALRKILSGLIPKRRNAADHAVWEQKDLLFLCFWGKDNDRTIGIAHFEDKESGLPTIKMISCAPAVEDFTQIRIFEDRLKSLKWPMNYMDHDKWQEDWSSAFTTGYKETIQNAATLTTRLAVEAQGIRNRILDILKVETANGYVHLLYEKFKDTLIHDMTETQFADMYAQTVVYGLFSARCMDDTQDDFSASEAVDCIPNTNPFLKSLMQECLGVQNTGKLSFDELEIGNVVELLLHTKTDSIMQDFNRQTGGGKEDPVIHFYEEFLTAYDKQQKVQRGVFYTPQPVVKYMVRAVDAIIKTEFGLEDGLASTKTKKIKYLREAKKKTTGKITRGMVEDVLEVPSIQVLDPATGTGTFIRQIILQVFYNYVKKRADLSKQDLQKAWDEYVPKHLLPRINAFELMMAPYAVAHMKLAMVLKDTGYSFKSNERLKVFLTNTLEKPGESENQLTLWSDPLAMESIEANSAKKNSGINICIGNPPYSGESANKNDWILNLMEDYKKEPGGDVKLNERNPKWLNDDYVKFIRFAQEVIKKSNQGIVAYINPHGFISNPTFRGMRWRLMKEFNKIFILDLHGNSNRKESAPNGGKDENVFDIQQGVCICIFIRKKDTKAEDCEVYHADLFGLRDEKYQFLNNTIFDEKCFERVEPVAPDYLFQRVDRNLRDEYNNGFSINDLFTIGSVGVVTARDGLTLGFTRKDIEDKAYDFCMIDPEIARVKYNLGKDVRDWKVSWAQNDIKNNAIKNNNINASLVYPIMYRPFDKRYILYTGTSRGFVCYPRKEVMEQFILGHNLGLATGRSNKSDECNHFFVTDMMMEAKCAERTTQSALFPIYSFNSITGKEINYNIDIINEFSKKIGLKYVPYCYENGRDTFNELDIFFYIYAILYSEAYRKKFKDFLQAGFPKIPYISNDSIFWELVSCGKELVKTHIGKIDGIDNIKFYGVDRRVEKIKFKDGNIYINKREYFSDITQSQWEYSIGGYKPLQRWFKDRKGRLLSENEIEDYKTAIISVKKTIEIVKKIESITADLF